MTTSAHLQDVASGHRLSLQSGQPLSTASLESGVIDMLLDRRLLKDDEKGLMEVSSPYTIVAPT